MNDSRIQKLLFSLKEIEGCLIENPVDLLYLTGLAVSKGTLWVSRQGTIFFVDGRYFEKAKKEAPCEVQMSESKKIKQELEKAERIGFDSDFSSYENFLALKALLPQVDWVPIPSPLKEIRVCKEKQEIEALKRAARLTQEGVQFAHSLLEEGITEEEIAIEFEFFCRKKGASGFSFESIIAFGNNSAFPHYRAGKTKLQKNQMALFDVGAIVHSYHADMTRTFFYGNPHPKLQFFEEVVRRAQAKVLEVVRPGISVGRLDEVARAEFRKEGVEQLYIHSLGHGIGLETHEYPRIRIDGKDSGVLLKSGMVFTVEPGLYMPGVGGVRLEDMILVTDQGYENFFATEGYAEL